MSDVYRGTFDGDTITVFAKDGSQIDKVSDVMWIRISQTEMLYEWSGSGPSGPCILGVDRQFKGISMPDGSVLRDGSFYA